MDLLIVVVWVWVWVVSFDFSRELWDVDRSLYDGKSNHMFHMLCCSCCFCCFCCLAAVSIFLLSMYLISLAVELESSVGLSLPSFEVVGRF